MLDFSYQLFEQWHNSWCFLNQYILIHFLIWKYTLCVYPAGVQFCCYANKEEDRDKFCFFRFVQSVLIQLDIGYSFCLEEIRKFKHLSCQRCLRLLNLTILHMILMIELYLYVLLTPPSWIMHAFWIFWHSSVVAHTIFWTCMVNIGEASLIVTKLYSLNLSCRNWMDLMEEKVVYSNPKLTCLLQKWSCK